MAVNLYKKRVKADLSRLGVGESVKYSTADIPYLYFRSGVHIAAAEVGVRVKVHCPKPFLTAEVKRVE